MVKSMFAGVSGLRIHQGKMDVIGNNIANVNTWGYKSQTANFRDSMYTTTTASSNGGGGYGGSNPSQVGYGVQLSSITMNFSVSSPSPTGRSLDCMMNGTGFFIVGPSKDGTIYPDDASAAANGGTSLKDSGLFLSRVGIFSVDNDGKLVDDQRNYIYGFASTVAADGTATIDKTKLVPISIPEDPNSTATPKEKFKLQSYSIQNDGTIVGVTKDNQTVTVGQLAVASVENINALEKQNGYYYSMGANTGNVEANVPGGVLGDALGGYLEMPNVDLAKEFADMITTQRGFQASSKIITVTDEMLQELVNIKR